MKWSGVLAAVAAGALLWSRAPSSDRLEGSPESVAPEATLVPRMPIVLSARRHRDANTPTASPTETRRPSATATPRRTASPTPSRTPSATPTPTPSSTPPPPPIFIYLRAVSWQWDFICTRTPCPSGISIDQTPGFPGMNTLTVKVGLTVQLWIYNGGPSQEPGVDNHTFSGIPALGLPGIPYPGLIPFPDGGTYVRGPSTTFTATPALAGSSVLFNCDDTACSTGDISMQHDLMHGWINVVP